MSQKLPESHGSVPEIVVLRAAFVIVLDRGINAKEKNIRSYYRWMKLCMLGGMGWIILVSGIWLTMNNFSIRQINLLQLTTTGIGLLPLVTSMWPYKAIGPQVEQVEKIRSMKSLLLDYTPISPEADRPVVDIV